MDNKYVKLHSLLRMFAALLAIIVFISMFITKQVVHSEFKDAFYDFRNGAFFGDNDYGTCKGNVSGFIGYLLVLLGGLAGLAFVFVDELIGKDLTKKLSFVVGGVVLVGALLIFLFAPIFKGINGLSNYYHTGAGPIVFGCFSVVIAAINAGAPILEDKGY